MFVYKLDFSPSLPNKSVGMNMLLQSKLLAKGNLKMIKKEKKTKKKQQIHDMCCHSN
jgi:hypothetical protein